MRVQMVKAPPAPLMDGFDMRGLRVGLVYDVGNALAMYLVVAGYAVLERAVECADDRKRDKAPQ